MKIGIITITDGTNYGNRLQNYALQQILLKMGDVEVETIQMDRKQYLGWMGRLLNICKYIIKPIIGKSVSANKRRMIFDRFNRKYIRFSHYTVPSGTCPQNLGSKYDLFVFGSDQIWNTNFKMISENIDFFLGSFAEANQKVAYAASFGSEKIGQGNKDLFQEQLSSFRAISVRENSGMRLAREFGIEKNVPVVLDPTLMLSGEQWENLAKKPDYINAEGFVLTYFLGGENQAIKNHIENRVNDNNSRVINLRVFYRSQMDKENVAVYTTGPEGFLWLIQHAKCVLTDSFHATVFSILFGKAFCVYERRDMLDNQSMRNRIDTLLTMTGLENCYDDIVNPAKIPQEFDRNRVEKIIDEKRKESLQFLYQAILQK